MFKFYDLFVTFAREKPFFLGGGDPEKKGEKGKRRTKRKRSQLMFAVKKTKRQIGKNSENNKEANSDDNIDPHVLYLDSDFVQISLTTILFRFVLKRIEERKKGERREGERRNVE